jgi:hypothetical protein
MILKTASKFLRDGVWINSPRYSGVKAKSRLVVLDIHTAISQCPKGLSIKKAMA